MIELTLNGENGFNVSQRCTPPTVYFDHWAWRKISESETLTKRFSQALKVRNGTLALSWLNVIEFCKVTDSEQTQKADALLSKIWPQIFILNPNFFKVIEKEDKILAKGEITAPHADLEMLRAILKLRPMNPESLYPLKMPNLFSLVRSTGVTYDDFADVVVGHIESLRQDYHNNRNFFSLVNRNPIGGQIECGTRFVARELLATFLKDGTLSINRNHAMDLSHAVVAVSYCDYVLLDSHWTTQVERVSKKLRDGGMTFPLAKVFSEKANGLERFIQELEKQAK